MKGHIAKNCRKAEVECFRCHKKGHYANECHFIDKNARQCDSDEGSSNCDYVDIFSTVDRVCGDDLVNVSVVVGKKDHTILMQEDTGASCTIISSCIWKELGSPKLKKFKGKALRSYDGTALKITGDLPLLITYRDHYDIHNVRVVESEKNFGLLGRDILSTQIHSVSAQHDKTKPAPLGCI